MLWCDAMSLHIHDASGVSFCGLCWCCPIYCLLCVSMRHQSHNAGPSQNTSTVELSTISFVGPGVPAHAKLSCLPPLRVPAMWDEHSSWMFGQECDGDETDKLLCEPHDSAAEVAQWEAAQNTHNSWGALGIRSE